MGFIQRERDRVSEELLKHKSGPIHDELRIIAHVLAWVSEPVLFQRPTDVVLNRNAPPKDEQS